MVDTQFMLRLVSDLALYAFFLSLLVGQKLFYEKRIKELEDKK